MHALDPRSKTSSRTTISSALLALLATLASAACAGEVAAPELLSDEPSGGATSNVDEPDDSDAPVVGRSSDDDDSEDELDDGTDDDDSDDGGLAEPEPTPTDKPTSGIYAEYFSGYHTRKVARIEPTINHDWNDTAPATGVGKDRFSARWTGTLTPVVTGKTKIIVDADDGTRVWIDGKLVINDWRPHLVERHSAEVNLTKDVPVSIRVEYFEVDLDASIRLSWSAGSALPEQVIPTARLSTKGNPSGLPGPKPPFKNPVIDSNCPDPGVLAANDLFYAVCTGGSFRIRSSRDLVTWKTVSGATILTGGKPSWAANGKRNWAPEIHAVGKKFVAYYTSVNQNDVLSIGAASADTPTGPWTDKGSPLVQHADGAIDATFFEDSDGSRWLFYKIDGNAKKKPTPLFVRKLTSNGLSFAAGSTAKQVLTNNASTWEGGVVEAPWVVKRGGYYYMFYSGNVYDHRYRTGVARAKKLTGPWEKRGAPILTNNASWVGPGHGSVVRVKNVDYFVYHAWVNAGNGTAAAGGRRVLVDKITWKNDWPTIANGSPSTALQPYPGESL